MINGQEVGMCTLSERLRQLKEAIAACEWELPIDAQETCLEAADELEYLQKIKEGVGWNERHRYGPA